MTFKPEEWTYEFQQRGGHPLLMADMWCQSLYDRLPKEIGFPIDGFDYLITSRSKGYYRVGMREILLDEFKTRLADHTYLEYVFEKTMQRVNEFAEYMQTKPEELVWEIYIEKVLNLIPWLFIPWYISEFNYLSDEVVKDLEKYRVEIEAVTDINNAVATLMFPDMEMEFQKEQAAFYELVTLTKSGIDIFSDKNAGVKINAYLRNFGWMKTFVVVPEEPLTQDELKEKIDTAIAEKSYETYQKQIEHKEKNKILFTKLSSIIEHDKDLMQKAADARYLAWLLTYSVEKSMRAFADGIPWYKNISRTIGVDYQDWAHFTISEIKNSLQKKQSTIPKDELAKRKRGYVFIVRSGVPDLYVGDEALSIIKTLEEKESVNDAEPVTEIRGKSASSGKVRGIVKVLATAKESFVVESGDILVTGMTTTDYVPAMKRAGAVVTDEGGLLCHAAIISRELGKPCVIATRNATRVLKSGDMVEVDADNGVVRILK